MPYDGAEPSATAHRRDRPAQRSIGKSRGKFSGKFCGKIFRSISCNIVVLEERPWLRCARPPYVCWPPLKPGLPALQS